MIPDDQLRFLTGMLLTMVLSFFLRYIPSYFLRLSYSLVLSLCLQFYLYGVPTLLPLSLHVFMYYLIKKVNREQCGAYAIVTSMVFLSLYYIYVMIVDFGRFQLDVSTTLMMSVCKYSLFAFSYQDGLANQKEQNEQRKQQRLQVLPSFFEYFNYMVFLPTCLINTPFQYSLFTSYIKQQKQFREIPLYKLLAKFGKQFIIGVICIGVYMFSLSYVPLSAIGNQDYLNKGLFHHLWYSYISIQLFKYRFFFGFIIMQLPVYASGLSYQPSALDDQFNEIRTIDIYKFETAYHLRDKVATWNMAVQQWLRKCVYQRLPYKKQKKQLVTFMVSAVWHGFYPGFYITFGLYFLQIYLGNIIYKFSSENQAHPLIKMYRKTEKYSFYICWFVWNWIFVNNSIYFMVLTIQKSYGILSLMKFLNPALLVLLILFFKSIQPSKKPNKKQ